MRKTNVIGLFDKKIGPAGGDTPVIRALTAMPRIAKTMLPIRSALSRKENFYGNYEENDRVVSKTDKAQKTFIHDDDDLH
jgi:hypothetical protein